MPLYIGGFNQYNTNSNFNKTLTFRIWRTHKYVVYLLCNQMRDKI